MVVSKRHERSVGIYLRMYFDRVLSAVELGSSDNVVYLMHGGDRVTLSRSGVVEYVVYLLRDFSSSYGYVVVLPGLVARLFRAYWEGLASVDDVLEQVFLDRVAVGAMAYEEWTNEEFVRAYVSELVWDERRMEFDGVVVSTPLHGGYLFRVR